MSGNMGKHNRGKGRRVGYHQKAEPAWMGWIAIYVVTGPEELTLKLLTGNYSDACQLSSHYRERGIPSVMADSQLNGYTVTARWPKQISQFKQSPTRMAVQRAVAGALGEPLPLIADSTSVSVDESMIDDLAGALFGPLPPDGNWVVC